MDDLEGVGLTRNEFTGRVNTGLGRLDELLSGGFPGNSITLVSGTPGSGKTIICYHYIAEGLKKGEKCLYLTSDERVESILKQAKEVGFDFWPYVDTGQLKFMYLDLDKSNILLRLPHGLQDHQMRVLPVQYISPQHKCYYGTYLVQRVEIISPTPPFLIYVVLP